MAKRSSLGKGLDALFIDNTTEDKTITNLKISQIEPNKEQPRTDFDQELLSELADSIRVHGVIQPLVVRPLDKGGYQIVAGERRWRAARMAGLDELPVVIRELDDNQTLEIAIIENLQREDLNPVELALGYRALIQEYGLTQEQVADKLGKSRPVIANTVRLLSLPQTVLDNVRHGNLSQGHARALLALEDEGLIEQVAERVLKDKLLVRDIEKLAKRIKTGENLLDPREVKSSANEAATWGDNYYAEMELALSQELGRKVKITNHGRKSTLELEFYDKNELADIAERLTRDRT